MPDLSQPQLKGIICLVSGLAITLIIVLCLTRWDYHRKQEVTCSVKTSECESFIKSLGYFLSLAEIDNPEPIQHLGLEKCVSIVHCFEEIERCPAYEKMKTHRSIRTLGSCCNIISTNVFETHPFKSQILQEYGQKTWDDFRRIPFFGVKGTNKCEWRVLVDGNPLSSA